jgi:hypothetical protein
MPLTPDMIFPQRKSVNWLLANARPTEKQQRTFFYAGTYLSGELPEKQTVMHR